MYQTLAGRVSREYHGSEGASRGPWATHVGALAVVRDALSTSCSEAAPTLVPQLVGPIWQSIRMDTTTGR